MVFLFISYKIACGKKGKKKKKEKKNTIARLGTNVRVRGFNAGLLARSQLHSEGPATPGPLGWWSLR
jgi:hypothetical protein